MSDGDGTIRIRVGDEEFDATPAALQRLRNQGVDYSSGPQQAPGDNNTNGKTWKQALETLGDTGRGAVHGATLGLADTKFGADNKSLPERLGLDSYDTVNERSPVASTVGDLGGSLILPGGVLGKGAGLAARIGEQALVGGVTGGIRSAAENGDWKQGAQDGAMYGAGGAAVLGGIASAYNKGAKFLSEALGSSADTLRTKAVGIGAAEMKGLASRFGVDELPKALAQHIEATVPSKGLGRSAENYASELTSRADDVGPKIDQVLERADSEGVHHEIPGAWASMLERLEGRAGKLEGNGRVLPQQVAEAGAMRKSVDALAGAEPPSSSPGLRKLKSGWQSEAYTGPGSSVPDTKNAAVAEAFGQEGRQALSDVMEHAQPNTRGEFEGLNKEYEGLALLRDTAAKRAAIEGADSKIPGLLGAVGGGAIGGLMNDDDPLNGAVLGALAGGFSGTRNYASQALSGTRAMDATANALRAGQRALKPRDLEVLRKFSQYAGKAGGIKGTNSDDTY